MESCMSVPSQSHKVRVFGSSIPICDATGSGLSILCLRCSAYADFTRWDPYTYKILKMGADICSLGCSRHTLRVFPLCASWLYCHGSQGIHFVKSKKSSIIYALYSLPKPQPNKVNAATCRQISPMLTACKSLPSLNAAVFHQTSGDLYPQDFLQLYRTSTNFSWHTLGWQNPVHQTHLLSIYSKSIPAELEQPCWELAALGLSPFLFRPILLLFREPH